MIARTSLQGTAAHFPRKTPHPALRALDVLVGTWRVSGGANGQFSFEWIDGGFFMMQRIDVDRLQGVEIIGYDERSRALKSQCFTNSGIVCEYEYEIRDDTLIISVNMPHMQGDFVGTFNDERTVCSGSWEWVENGITKGYDTTFTRIQ